MRALVTGVTGFVGQHLARWLLRETPWEIGGVAHGEARLAEDLAGQVRIYGADLRDPEATRRIMADWHPDVIFHLAALAQVGASFQNPWRTLGTNARIQLNMLEATVAEAPAARVMVVGSGDEYGLVQPDELPCDEHTPLRPANPYAVSKVTQDMLGLQYHLSAGLDVVRVRPFNHTGPGQGEGFVAPDLARQVAAIEVGLQEPVMRVGNLEAERDLTDVRDVVRAYLLLAQQGVSGEVYNIGSGQAHAMREVLELLLRDSKVPIRVEPDPARMRPSDVPRIVCDAGKLASLTGWAPTIPFARTIADVLDDWRARLSGDARADQSTQEAPE
ncbi:MAG: GDP-mannose 4,6-dehydratase [Anaerolineae bacterium]|nr:GDP-mannose 4,6-dehydratase [Anaerolineae bacterium]